MKKFVTVTISLCMLMVIGMIAFFSSLPRTAPADDASVLRTADRLARGDYLFNAILGCPVCHSERDFSKFGGPPVPPFGGGRACAEPGEQLPGLAESGGLPGSICFRNITPHETGIGAWSDGEILRAIREGVDRHGNALFPIMPTFIYRQLSDEDTRSVLTYLRRLEPIDHPLPETDVDFPVSWLIRLLPKPLAGPVEHPPESDAVTYGQYLATVARCAFCHSPRDARSRQPIDGYEFAGGVEFQGRNGTMFSTNLTRHASGLSAMSQPEFIALFRRESDPSATDLNLMPWTYFANMTDADLGAIYLYLQTVDPVEYRPELRQSQ